MMNRQLKVQDFLDKYARYDEAGNKLNEVIGFWYEGELGEAIGRLMDDHITLLEQDVGLVPDWIQWYIYDNDCGKHELEVTVGGETRKICNLDGLFWAAGPKL